MRYELPKSLKRHSFWCNEVKDFVNFNKCTNYCSKSNEEENQKCWENSLRKDLIMDCDITNEKNAEDYAICPSCQSDDIVSCAFNSFLCSQCGAIFSLDREAQKQCLGELYLEINDEALNVMYNKIK